MRKFTSFILSLITAFTPVIAMAQQPEPAQNATPAIRVQTRVVLVDVLATDNSGKAVTDLKPEDFTVEDAGHKQKVAFFSLEQPSSATAPEALPPNVYSNRPEFNRASGPLTVLLIDMLNTPVTNQGYARAELLKYIDQQFGAGQRIAVYALGNQLRKMQDFTSDPAVLRAAIEKVVPQVLSKGAPGTPGETRISSALGGLTGPHGETGPAQAAAIGAALRSVQDFQSAEVTSALQVRMGATVESLRMLSRILTGYRGRKNLVWVAAAFPFSLTPQDTEVVSAFARVDDPTAPPPLPNELAASTTANQVEHSFNDEIRKTTTMLSEAQVAIYPVDAKGLLGASIADASRSGLNAVGLLEQGHEFGSAVRHSTEGLAANQAVMSDLATQTGGRAFTNRNDIDNAVALASADAASYYTLGYYPDKKKFDGGYHKIKIQTARQGARLRYRNGYFALDTTSPNKKQRESETGNLLRSTAVNSTMVYFDALVVPPAVSANPAKVPVKFRVQPSSFTSEEAGGGRRKINLDFFIAVLAKDGRMLNTSGNTVDATLEAEQFAQLQQMGLLVPMELELAPGDYDLRLAVRDNRTGYLGSLTAPVSIAKP